MIVKSFRQILRAVLLTAGMLFFVFLLRHAADGDMTSYRTDILFHDSVILFVSTLPLLAVDFRKICWGLTDGLLVCLAGLYTVSAYVHGHTVSAVALQEVFPYALLYFSVKVLLASGGRMTRLFLFSAFCVWSCIESVMGLSQVFGRMPSGHHAFGMTGSFSNPGPYGCFISMTMAVAAGYAVKYRATSGILCPASLKGLFSIRRSRVFKSLYFKWIVFRLSPFVLAAAVLMLGIMVLPASMSRAGWLGFGAALVAVLLVETDFWKRLKRRTVTVAVSMFVLAAVFAGIFVIKKDSAIGRLHIWNMEVWAISDSPLIGTGPGTALGAYGRAQESYFRSGDRPEAVVRVAGCPEYAFNEYLKGGMESGIPGLLLFMSVPVVAAVSLLRRREAFSYGVVAAAVFSFFSYPLSVMPLAVGIALLLASAGCYPNLCRETGFALSYVLNVVSVLLLSFGACSFRNVFDDRADAVSDWQAARQWSGMELYDDAAEALGDIYPEMSWNYRYIYDYGYALNKTGDYERSNAVLEEGAAISSDPMFHNIMGKNHAAVGHYADAEVEFMTSHYMVPCRLYPLVLLMEMYEEQGDRGKAVSTGRKILDMPVNPKNTAMRKLNEKAMDMME